jgi:hypothetical protein
MWLRIRSMQDGIGVEGDDARVRYRK